MSMKHNNHRKERIVEDKTVTVEDMILHSKVSDALAEGLAEVTNYSAGIADGYRQALKSLGLYVEKEDRY